MSIFPPKKSLLFLSTQLNFTVRKVSSNYESFSHVLNTNKNIVCLTGAGISMASGVPLYKGFEGKWRIFKLNDLATPEAFYQNPGLVWEYYHYRRELSFKAKPNKAHLALAHFENQCIKDQKNFCLITQNIDGLHTKAGSKNIIELHGNLTKVQCTKCKHVEVNTKQPLCPALRGKGDPRVHIEDMVIIETEDLPKCVKCNGLLRPYVVWFGEDLHEGVGDRSEELVGECELLLVIGSSGVVYPGALFGPMVHERGGTVAEFNTDQIPEDYLHQYYFQGPSEITVPKALGVTREL